MSFTFEIRGRTAGAWSLSSQCLEQIERLNEAGGRQNAAVIFGGEETVAGTGRAVERAALLRAVQELLPLAETISGGFQMRAQLKIGSQSVDVSGSRGAGGLLVKGRYHVLACAGDYWTLQPTEDAQAGKPARKRRRPAEIQTENMGVVKVEAAGAKTSELAKLLRAVRVFVKKDSNRRFTVVWG